MNGSKALAATLMLSTGLLAGAVSAQPCQCSIEERVLGVLQFNASPPEGVIAGPGTVEAEQEFQLTINTYGGGCDRAGDHGVVYTTQGASIFVYDFTTETRPDVVCPAILKRLTHTVNLSFDTPGQVVLRVWGRRTSPGTLETGEPVVMTHRITVM